MSVPAYRDCERLIKSLAWRFYRRACAAGASSIQIEDIISELSVAYCIAKDRYDPKTNVPFLAYFTRGARHHVNRWLESEIRFGHFAELDAETGEEASLHEVLPSDDLTAEDIVAAGQIRSQALQGLSADARMFLELLESPPQALIKAFGEIAKRRDYARSRGIPSCAPKALTGAVIMDVLGIEAARRRQVYRELKAMAQRIGKQ